MVFLMKTLLENQMSVSLLPVPKEPENPEPPGTQEPRIPGPVNNSGGAETDFPDFAPDYVPPHPPGNAEFWKHVL